MTRDEKDETSWVTNPTSPGHTASEVFNLLIAAQNGSPEACLEMSRCYAEGEGIRANLIEACAWRLAAALISSEVVSMEHLKSGFFLSPEEITEAEELAEQYVALSSHKGFENLAERIESGDEEALAELMAGYEEVYPSASAAEKLLDDALKDPDGLPTPEAIYQLILLAEKGDGPACLALADFYYLSDEIREIKYWKWMDSWKASNQPEQPRFTAEYGFGPEISDRSMACAWLCVGAEAGDAEALVALESLQMQLPFNEFQDAEMLAQQILQRKAADNL